MDILDRGSSRVGGDMQPRTRWNEVEIVAEILPYPSRQHVTPFAIGAAHLANVARKGALVDELSQRDLRNRRGMPVGDELCLARRLAQRRRHDHERQPETRQQRLRERSDIDNATGRIEGLKRLERTSAEAKLAIIVVLDDNRVV